MRGGVVGAVLRELSGFDKFRIEIAYPGPKVELRILNGGQGWNQSGTGPLPMHGAMRLQAARLSLPQLLVARRNGRNDVGPLKGRDGADLRRLHLPLDPGLSLFIDADLETGLVKRSIGVIMVNGQAIEFISEYADFKVWEGIMLPGREKQYAMGQYIGYTMIDLVEFPQELMNERFQP